MKAFKYIIVLALISFLFTCSDDGDNDASQLQQFESQLCPNQGIVGPTAIYWDSAHGKSTPLSQIPTIANPGKQFIHSQYPPLGFFMPQGYDAIEILEQQSGAIGVNVRRDDGNVVWKYIPSSSYGGNINVIDVIDFELTQAKIAHNFDPNTMGTLLCAENDQSNEFGFPTTVASRLITFGEFTAILVVQAHFMPTLNHTFITVTRASGKTSEFDSLVMETFLPIHWQLLVISDDVRDSDLDGTPDKQDSAPFNPNIQ